MHVDQHIVHVCSRLSIMIESLRPMQGGLLKSVHAVATAQVSGKKLYKYSIVQVASSVATVLYQIEQSKSKGTNPTNPLPHADPPLIFPNYQDFRRSNINNNLD